MKSNAYFSAVVAAALALTAQRAEAASVLSQVFIAQGDGSFLDTQPYLQSTTFGQPVQATNTITHARPTGGTLTYNASVFASTTYQSLKAGTSASVSNTYFDPNYTFDSDGTQTGVPTNYDTYARSSFTETLQYGGTAVNYTSRYYLNLSGRIVPTGLPDEDGQNFLRGPQVTVRLRHANEPTQVWSFTEAGEFNLPIISSTYIHGATPQTFFLEVITNIQYRMETLTDGSTISGSADFGSTLTFTGVELRDAATGALQPGNSITNDEGQSVPVVAPEPASAGLLLLGAGALLRRRRR